MEVIFVEGVKPDNEFTPRFQAATAQELVDAYNRLVGNQGWVAAKGRYLYALYEEFKRRQIDISVIDTGAGLRLDQQIVLGNSGQCVAIE